LYSFPFFYFRVMQFDIQETVTGGSEIVSLSEAKAHLRVSYSDEDTMITRMIKTAREWVEQYTQQILIDKTLTVQFYDLAGELRFELPFGPVDSITSVKRILADGTEQTLVEGTNYRAQGLSRKVLKFNQFYSSGALGGDYQLKVVYDVITQTKDQTVYQDAILKLVEDMYRNRGNSESENPRGGISGKAQIDCGKLLAEVKHKTWL